MPGKTFRKKLISEGTWGKKPFQGSACLIEIQNCPRELEPYNGEVVIGDIDGDMGRLLDDCLKTMNENEKAEFTLLQFRMIIQLEMKRVDFNGFICDWNVRTKIDMALKHKDKGIEYYKTDINRDAAFRFAKALKILSSIPIDSQQKPTQIGGVKVVEIGQLKAQLFNNLASCYLKNEAWLTVIEICKKVFKYDKENVKANYKIGVAYFKDRNYEKAEKAFNIVLKNQPDNKAAIEYMKLTKEELHKANVRVNNMVKKMFPI